MTRSLFGMLVLTTLAPLVGITQQASADVNLVVNGGFETGTFSGFIVQNADAHTAVSTTFVSNFVTYSPNTGSFFAALGNPGSDATISQTITDTAGANYIFSFFLASDGKVPNDFTAKWNSQSLMTGTSLAASPYTQYSFAVQGTGSDTISFLERNDPGFLSLDDVSLVATVVPEPSSMFLTGLPILACLLYLGWKRTSSNALACKVA